MIEVATERLVALSKVGYHLPSRSTGQPVHVSTVYRWCTAGVRGVRLERVTIGGSTYTSVEAIQRFAERLTAGGAPQLHPAHMHSAHAERVARLVEHRLRLGCRARRTPITRPGP
jgi:hypothetical protein